MRICLNAYGGYVLFCLDYFLAPFVMLGWCVEAIVLLMTRNRAQKHNVLVLWWVVVCIRAGETGVRVYVGLHVCVHVH